MKNENVVPSETKRKCERVRVLGLKGWREAPCTWQEGGLAVTLAKKTCAGPIWTITHLASGGAVPGLWTDPESAQHAARLLLPLADWTQPESALMEAWRANPAFRAQVKAVRVLSEQYEVGVR